MTRSGLTWAWVSCYQSGATTVPTKTFGQAAQAFRDQITGRRVFAQKHAFSAQKSPRTEAFEGSG